MCFKIVSISHISPIILTAKDVVPQIYPYLDIHSESPISCKALPKL